MPSPIHSGRITTPPAGVDSGASTSRPPSHPHSKRHSGHLEGPSDLASRPQSSRLADTGSQRLRQPAPEIGTASPEHAQSQLLRAGERSESQVYSSAHFSMGSSLHGAVSSARSDEITEIETWTLQEWSVEAPRAGEPPAPFGQEPPALEQPAAKRSWLGVASALASGLKQAAGWVKDEAMLSLKGVTSTLMPEAAGRLAGALAGHSIHQTIAVGIPTFAREMVGVGVMHAMRHTPEHAAIGIQLAVGVVNFASQVTREWLEQRNPDAAARAYFSLDAEQWAAKSPEEQADMRAHQRAVSRRLTLIQVAASATNLTMMVQGYNAGDRAGALRGLGNEVKVAVYATMRDGIQASFSMVGLRPSPDAEPGKEFAAGMAGPSHAAAAATYAAANSASAFLSDALMGAWVPERNDAMASLMSLPEAHMGSAEAWLEIAKGAGVSAMTNTLAETIDWFQRMEHFVNETGATQAFEPKVTGNDLARVFDQAPARAAAFNGLFAVLTLAGREMGKSDLPLAVQQFIGNVGLGLMIATLDSPLTGLWQAEEAVRAEPTPRPAATLTELEEGTANVPFSGELSGGSDSEASRVTGVSAGNPPERHRSPSPDPV